MLDILLLGFMHKHTKLSHDFILLFHFNIVKCSYSTFCHGSGCLLGSPCCPVILAAHGLGNQCQSCSRNARITSWFSPTCRLFPRSLICPYVLLLVVSRFFCPCSCLHVTLLSLPVPLLPCAAWLIARRSSSSCSPQNLPAGAGISSS